MRCNRIDVDYIIVANFAICNVRSTRRLRPRWPILYVALPAVWNLLSSPPSHMTV